MSNLRRPPAQTRTRMAQLRRTHSPPRYAPPGPRWTSWSESRFQQAVLGAMQLRCATPRARVFAVVLLCQALVGSDCFPKRTAWRDASGIGDACRKHLPERPTMAEGPQRQQPEEFGGFIKRQGRMNCECEELPGRTAGRPADMVSHGLRNQDGQANLRTELRYPPNRGNSRPST